jgi:hypothetical protein
MTGRRIERDDIATVEKMPGKDRRNVEKGDALSPFLRI